MKEQGNPWVRALGRTAGRRALLRGVGIGLASGVAAYGLACGGGKQSGGAASTAGSPAPGGTATAGGPRPGGQVRQAQPRDLPHYDPHTETYPAGFMVALVHAGLLKFKGSDDPNDLQVEPYLAQSLEQPDPTTLVIKLRPNAKFQNAVPVKGRTITAEDVKFSFERIKTDKPEFQRRTFFAAVDAVEAVDTTTARFRLSAPFAPLQTYLADTWNVIVPKEVVDRDGDMRKTAVGAGPFLLQSYEKGVGLIFKKNPDFFIQGRPYVDEVRMPVIVDPPAQLAAFRSKQTDFMRNIPWSDVPALRRDPTIMIKDYKNVDLQYIRINTHVKPLDDPRVRRALSLALNRQAVVQTAFQGNGMPAGVFPPGVRYALKPEELPYYKYDVNEAKNLLRAAGYENGFKVMNLYPSGSGNQQAMATVVIDQLRAIGVQVENKTLEYGAYLQAAFSKEFEINIHWGNRYDEVDGYAIEYLTTGGRNFGYWGTPELDALIKKQRETLNADERGKILAEIQRYIADQMYTVGIANWTDFDGWYSRLQNFQTSVHWFLPTQRFAEVWVSG
jgi:peptide/nickel transport system substrate-binding protein